MKKEFRSFKDARKFVHSLKLKDSTNWINYCKSGKKPDDIPSDPRKVYKKEWKSMGDWLDTGVIASFNRTYKSFSNARKFVHSLKLKNSSEWKTYCKSGKKPDDIPNTPRSVYKKEWRGVGDWLGTGRIATMKKEFLSFLEARQFVHSLNIKSNSEWRNYCKSGKKPDDIPTTPARTYKNKGWINEGDWLGTGTIASYNIKFKTFDKAKKFVHSLNFQNEKQWRQYCKSGNKPDDIPASPEKPYKKEWKGISDWLGTKRIANQDKKYLPFLEARKLIRSLGMKNVDDWRKWCKSDIRQENIPAHPHVVYKKEWIAWNDWLGTENMSPSKISKNYLPFKEAKIEARKIVKKYGIKNRDDWMKAVKEGKIPKNIPLVPGRVYSKKRKK